MPNASSTAYSDSAKPTITTAKTLKAIAVKDGMTNSDILTVEYTISTSSGGDDTNKVATPTASPVAGAVASDTAITLASSTSGAAIYYTLDGSVPSASGTAYSDSAKPTITTAKTLKAIAVKDGMTNSDILTAEYTISTSGGGGSSIYTIDWRFQKSSAGTEDYLEEVTAGKSTTFPSQTKADYYLEGWYTAASGGTKVGTPDDSYTPAGDITLYAHWAAASAPKAPTGITAVSNNDGSVTVSWTAVNVKDSGATGIDQYTVYYQYVVSGNWSDYKIAGYKKGDQTSLVYSRSTYEQSQSYTQYRFFVKATNDAVMESAYSTASSSFFF
jgi:uncharacterized repeat protein (TIGR02543 family)